MELQPVNIIHKMRIDVYDSDLNDYIDLIRIFGLDASGSETHTFDFDTENGTGIGYYENSLGYALAYRNNTVYINTVGNGALDLEFSTPMFYVT